MLPFGFFRDLSSWEKFFQTHLLENFEILEKSSPHLSPYGGLGAGLRLGGMAYPGMRILRNTRW